MPRPIEHPIKNAFMKKVWDGNHFEEIKQLAQFFGVGHSTARKWLFNESLSVTYDMALKIAGRLEMPVTDVIEGMRGC